MLISHEGGTGRLTLAVMGACLLTLSAAGTDARAGRPGPPEFEPLPGAIFTTTEHGAYVNRNHYAYKENVYLDGGPGPNAPVDAAGLPDGDYYFQVTDPSGKTLLSTDTIGQRQFRVTGGIITGLSGNGDHVTGLDVDHGATTIRLMPYADTPNNGGVYKVWVTRVANYSTDRCRGGCFHGFWAAASKTDNYKVGPGGSPCIDCPTPGEVEPCLTIQKYKDRYCPIGCLTDEEPWQLRWPITVVGPDNIPGPGTLWTTPSPTLWDDPVEPLLKLCNLMPGTYVVTEGDTGELFPNDPTPWYAEVTVNELDGELLVPPSRTVSVTIGYEDRVLKFGNAIPEDADGGGCPANPDNCPGFPELGAGVVGDPSCANGGETGSRKCNDGKDNDRDGCIDADDPDCQ